MLKALDLTINSLGSGSVVGKKGKKRTQFLSLFPQCGAWSQAKPLTTVTLFSVLLFLCVSVSALVQSNRFTLI